jgi:CheY-like chemotaxis protein
MTDRVRVFGDVAKGLARNPLGIIALFIVLVYSFASLVAAFAGSFTAFERLPLIYFMVCFPVLVLAVFAWLVSKYPWALFGPSDFKDEDNYVIVASLALAKTKNQEPLSKAGIQRLVELVRSTSPQRGVAGDNWRNQVLWVDDQPNNNVYERRAFETVGLCFTLALSTNAALDMVAKQRFAAIISDMGRKEGPREGYVLLDALRQQGNQIPVFFYASSNAPEHKRETFEHGGQDCTNDAEELFQMVIRAVNMGPYSPPPRRSGRSPALPYPPGEQK